MAEEIITETNRETATDHAYGGAQIQVLEGLEAVRKRPGMYIGSTGPSGLHHLVYEIVDNAIDEALAGYCTHIEVTIKPGNIIEVSDNGRGIPVDIQPKLGIPAVTVVYTVLHAGGKFGGEDSGYKVAGGLHGVGASVVNALSEWLTVRVRRDGAEYEQSFKRGKPDGDLKKIGAAASTGTTVTFKPDPEMFQETTLYRYETLLKRLREEAFLNAGVKITLTDERPDADRPQDEQSGEMRTETMCYEGGIRSFVSYLCERRDLTPLHPQVMYMKGEGQGAVAEVALQYYDNSYNELLLSFANNVHTPEGGTHEEGFKLALTRVLNEYGRAKGILKDKDENLSGPDAREGIIAVVSVKLQEAQFEGQTKAKLGNTFIKGLVNNVVYKALTEFFEENPAVAKQILEKGNEYGGSKFTSTDRVKLRAIANEMASQQVWVNYIVFTDLYGHVYQLNNVNLGTYDFYNYYSDKDILEESWVKQAKAAQGKEIFFRDSILKAGTKKGFSYAKYMINPSDGQGMGYMVVGLSQKLLGKSFVMGNESFDSSNFMVVDEDDQLVYFVGNEERENAIMQSYSNPGENHLYLFSSVTNSTTGWHIVNVVEKNEISEESKNIRLTSFLVAGCVLVVGFLMARIISRTISHPLKQLENTIAQVGEGERHITEEFDYSEVGRIGRKFKEMVNTNLELSEHLMAVKLNEREAELLLLQSQINPHFLYNTLDSLYFVAIMHGDDQMAEMVEALSDNFKLALNNGSKYIKVADSVKWMQGYMKLQNMRYNNRFELFVDISREILQRETITFIFQPFIENAMYHGLEPKIGKGKISLRGWQEQNNMIFTIEDDGVGIDDMSRLENGYGVRNVIERIKLNYGEKYGVTFESSPGNGTKVTIVVPVR